MRETLNRDNSGIQNSIIGIIILIIVSLIAVGFYFFTNETNTPETKPSFEVQNLTISESRIEMGQTAIAEVEVGNTGGETGTYTIKLKLDGEIYDSKEIEIDAKSSKIVDFPLELQSIGTHTVSIADFSEELEVVAPAKFVITDLKIEPKEVEPGESVKVSVDLKNVGGIEGSREVQFYVDNSIENTKSVTLPSGENTKVSVKIKKNENNTYNVRVDNLTGTFRVVSPIALTVSELKVTPKEIAPGDNVIVSAVVKNPGDVKVEQTLEFRVENEVVKEVYLSLDSGDTEEVTLSIQENEKKDYTIRLGSKSEEFSVVSVVNRKILYNDSISPPEDAFILTWSGADWGGPEAEFDNNFGEIDVPEGETCFRVSSGGNWADSVNYAGFGIFFGTADNEGNVQEKSTLDLSAYEYLRLWIKSPKSLTVEIETLGGDKPEVMLKNCGWSKEKPDKWQKILIPKEKFGLSNYSEIYGGLLITHVGGEMDFYVDNVAWVNLTGGNMPPSAGFAFSPESPSASDTIQFNNESSDPEGNIESYTWNFGDGTTSNEEDPTHSYSENGIYTVELRVTDDAGSSDTHSQKIVVGNQTPVAKFDYSPRTPGAGENIQFTEASSDYENRIESFSWNFGDGTSSDERNPIHSYSENGIYSVKLTVKDNYGAEDTYKWDVPVGVYLENANWQVAWLEEFEENRINRSAWSFDVGGWGWGNKELEYHADRRKNARIENNKLIIEAHEENYKNRNYTSARIKTQGNRYWTHGKIEARIKLPYGQGIWPAFWMLGESFADVGWPACGEIDVMEMVGGGEGRDDTVYGTIHYQTADGIYNHVGDSTSLSSGIFADAYHVFGIEWTAEKIIWYLDGEQYFSTSISAEDMSEFHEDFFIILNVAVGGNWPGAPNEETEFPQRMYVDWVRVSKPQ